MKADPRPAFVSAGEVFGGVERHILGMCTWMLRHGRTPLLVLFNDRKLAHEARKSGVEPEILEARSSVDLKIPGRLSRFLSAHRVNVVHAHGYRAMVNVALASRRHDFGVVRTVHGLAEGKGWFTPRAVKGRLYSGLERFAARSTGATVCYVTRDLREACAQADHGLSARTVYNGIDALERALYPRPADLEEGVFNLGAVGRVTAVKGLEYALEAVSLLGSGVDVVLNIIGTGPLEAALGERAQVLGVSERVRFLGFKDNIYDYLAHVDTLVMPSLHEGLPYTVLEALSLGTPILASNTGGLKEVLQDRETALLVDVGDVESLAGAITELVRNGRLARELGKAGRRLQTEEFNLETMGGEYWRAYGEVMR